MVSYQYLQKIRLQVKNNISLLTTQAHCLKMKSRKSKKMQNDSKMKMRKNEKNLRKSIKHNLI